MRNSKFMLNGVMCEHDTDIISYEEICHLAEPSMLKPVLSVVWKVLGTSQSGILYSGEKLSLNGDIVINACLTGVA